MCVKSSDVYIIHMRVKIDSCSIDNIRNHQIYNEFRWFIKNVKRLFAQFLVCEFYKTNE